VQTAGDWTSCDPAAMRQLSTEGRAIAVRIGEAIRTLGVPVATVLSSEYCRAWETARLLDLGPVTRTRDIMNMRAARHVGGRDAVIRRAQRVLAQPPPGGANVVVVGHGNLMRAATGAYVGEAGSGVYAARAENEFGVELVAELAPDDWMRSPSSSRRTADLSARRESAAKDPLTPNARSPRITHLAWGRIEVEDGRIFKDAKLWPGGVREWDWNETGTRHRPGIQPADVQELLQHGAEVVVLSKGVLQALQVCPQTLELLKRKGIPAHVLQTEETVRLYNQLAETRRVAGLFHSTC